MNLVQINERLKGLPMQVVQQYANGMNPEVPPYLALGELQRRELSQKQMATAQGGAQGPQPSVKEQVEQKAGLMAAQALQQQQMMQQQAQPQGAMPAPAGIPQPEQQPEATMMARGGLASVPVEFDFAGGGIVAFEGGGKADKYETPYDRMNRKNRGELTEKEREELARYEALLAQIPTGGEPTVTGGERVSGNELSRNVQNTAMALPGASAARALSGSAGAGRGVAAGLAALTSKEAPESQAASAAAPRVSAPPFEQAALRRMDAKMLPPGLAGAAMDKGITPSGGKPPAPRQQTAPQDTPPAAPAAAAQPQQDEISRLALEAVREKAKALTPEEAMAQEGKFAAQYGLDKKFGEEERGLLALMKQRQADFAKRRPMEELGATLRGFGQGYGGASAAGERAGRETYDMDMANQREMLNAIAAINKENLATGKERYKSGSGLFGEDQKSTAAANRERAQTLGQMRGQDITASTADANRKTQERGQDIQVQVAKIQAAATRDARAQGADDKQIAAAEAAFARDPEAAALKKGLEMFAMQPNSPKAADMVRRLREIQASKYKQFGITLEGAPSAQSPSGTRPPLSSFQR
jgi:hypothetical protein